MSTNVSRSSPGLVFLPVPPPHPPILAADHVVALGHLPAGILSRGLTVGGLQEPDRVCLTLIHACRALLIATSGFLQCVHVQAAFQARVLQPIRGNPCREKIMSMYLQCMPAYLWVNIYAWSTISKYIYFIKPTQDVTFKGMNYSWNSVLSIMFILFSPVVQKAFLFLLRKILFIFLMREV